MPSVRTLEIVSAVLLSAATLTTAWSGYQASRWNGEQAKAAARATRARVESAQGRRRREPQRPDRHRSSSRSGSTPTPATRRRSTSFYRQRFRAEFKPAFEAWVAMRPLRNPQAPLSPFAMPQYVLEAETEAKRWRPPPRSPPPRRGGTSSAARTTCSPPTLFAATLFFAGISTRLTRPGPRTTVLALGCLLFAGTLIWVATPVSVSVDRGEPHSNALIANAVAKPSVVKMPTSLPPCWNASGIIVSASIVRIAPPAKASTNATTLGEAPSKNA